MCILLVPFLWRNLTNTLSSVTLLVHDYSISCLDPHGFPNASISFSILSEATRGLTLKRVTEYVLFTVFSNDLPSLPLCPKPQAF